MKILFFLFFLFWKSYFSFINKRHNKQAGDKRRKPSLPLKPAIQLSRLEPNSEEIILAIPYGTGHQSATVCRYSSDTLLCSPYIRSISSHRAFDNKLTSISSHHAFVNKLTSISFQSFSLLTKTIPIPKGQSAERAAACPPNVISWPPARHKAFVTPRPTQRVPFTRPTATAKITTHLIVDNADYLLNRNY